ncbi:MAG: hypothetical protein DMD43_08410, partial [Gemmatimonadetes bacterium]
MGSRSGAGRPAGDTSRLRQVPPEHAVNQRFQDALRGARAGYAELRLRRVWSTTILIRDSTVEAATTSLETGGIARCCSPETGWGVTGWSDDEHLEAHLVRAHELSLAGGSRRPVRLAPIPVRQLDAAEPLPDDPREVPLHLKRRRAESLAGAILAVDRRVAEARLLYRDEVVETWLATSEGTWLHDLRPEVSVAALAVAEEEGNVERALGSLAARAGWRGLDAAGLMHEVAGRAIARLRATPLRPGRYTLVLDPAAAGALVHRAVAHMGPGHRDPDRPRMPHHRGRSLGRGTSRQRPGRRRGHRRPADRDRPERGGRRPSPLPRDRGRRRLRPDRTRARRRAPRGAVSPRHQQLPRTRTGNAGRPPPGRPARRLRDRRAELRRDRWPPVLPGGDGE